MSVSQFRVCVLQSANLLLLKGPLKDAFLLVNPGNFVIFWMVTRKGAELDRRWPVEVGGVDQCIKLINILHQYKPICGFMCIKFKNVIPKVSVLAFN